jgi:hypothetical protein
MPKETLYQGNVPRVYRDFLRAQLLIEGVIPHVAAILGLLIMNVFCETRGEIQSVAIEETLLQEALKALSDGFKLVLTYFAILCGIIRWVEGDQFHFLELVYDVHIVCRLWGVLGQAADFITVDNYEKVLLPEDVHDTQETLDLYYPFSVLPHGQVYNLWFVSKCYRKRMEI